MSPENSYLAEGWLSLMSLRDGNGPSNYSRGFENIWEAAEVVAE